MREQPELFQHQINQPETTVTQRIQEIVDYFSNPEPIYNPNFRRDDLSLTIPETGDNILHILVRNNNPEAVERFIDRLNEVKSDDDAGYDYLSARNLAGETPFIIAINAVENFRGQDQDEANVKAQSLRIFELISRDIHYGRINVNGMVEIAVNNNRFDIIGSLESDEEHADWLFEVNDNHGLVKSCKEGNIEAFKFFVSEFPSRTESYVPDDNNIDPHEHLAENKEMIDRLYSENSEMANKVLNSFFNKLFADYDANGNPNVSRENVFCDNRQPLLHRIIERKNEKLLKFLIDSRIDRNDTHKDEEFLKQTEGDEESITKKDTRYGIFISPDETDPTNNESALNFAIRIQQIEMVKILIEYGADTDLQDNDQRTAMHYIANGLLADPNSQFYREALILMVLGGANMDIYDSNSETPMDIIDKMSDHYKYEIKSMIDIVKKNKELSESLEQFVNEIESDQNLPNKERLLRNLANALKGNKEAIEEGGEQANENSLVDKIVLLIQDGADPLAKNIYDENYQDILKNIKDDKIKKDITNLIENTMIVSNFIFKIKSDRADYDKIGGGKSEMLLSVESKIKNHDLVISDEFKAYCIEAVEKIMMEKKSPSPSSLLSPTQGSLFANSTIDSSKAEGGPSKRQRT